jgi:hypothetical protein
LGSKWSWAAASRVRVGADDDGPQGAARGGDADVEAAGAGAVDGGEEVVAVVDAARGEDRHLAAEQGADLLAGAAGGGGRADDLRRAQDAVDGAGREEVDRGLVEADHRAERAGDQVELVLDDQLGRIEALRQRASALGRGVHHAVDAQVVEVGGAAEQHAGLAAPRHHGELVDGGDQEVGELLVDLLVDEEDRQALARPLLLGVEAIAALAVDDGAGELGLAGLAVVVDQLDVVDLDVLAAPGAGGQRERRVGAAGGEVVEGGVDLLEAVGGGALADPEADGEAGVAEAFGVAAAQLLERAHQGGGAAELVEGEEPQGVAEDDGDAAALVGAGLAAQAAEDQREGDEAEVGLGLAAAGREVDQVGDAAVACFGSATEARLSRMKASWNGRQRGWAPSL